MQSGMRRYGIEDETWFEATRTGLERRGFTLRIQPRSIIIDKDGRLPRIVGSAREFLEFGERQGLLIDPASFDAADLYGDGRSDLTRRQSDSPFERPYDDLRRDDLPARESVSVMADLRRPDVSAVELRLAELQLEQERLTTERRAVRVMKYEKQLLEERCATLEAELDRLTAVADEAVKQRDLWQMSAASAEERLRVMQTDDGPPAKRGSDKKFDQLRRFLARELHPDLAGEDGPERKVREALFKRVWAKIEQLQ